MNREASGIDQLTALVFELFNMQGLPAFDEICDRAAAGELTRDEFADRMLEQEMVAVRETQRYLAEEFGELSKKERSEARVYYGLLHGPRNLEGLLERYEDEAHDPRQHFHEMFDTEIVPD